MDCAIILVETSKQKQFEAALDVIFAQLELCLDFVDFFVFERRLFKRVQVKGDLWVVQSEFANTPKETGLKNHLYVQSVFHALKVLCWVFDGHHLALLVLYVVLVDNAEQLRANA